VPGRKAAMHVLGCKVNQTEAEAIANLFREAGYEIVDFSEKADVYVIHTCTVTKESDRKSRQAIRRAVKTNPEAVVAVTGCYAQVCGDNLMAMEGVDLVLGISDRRKVVELVEEVRKKGKPIIKVRKIEDIDVFEDLPYGQLGRARAFLKVQEGCQQFCSYCIVPYARGPVRSMPLEDALARVRKMVALGYKEIVITGIRLGAYGCDLKPARSLAELLHGACRVPRVKRLRVSSVDPNDFTPELVGVLTEEGVICPHYHIPLQSGDDYLLKRMRRRYTTAEYGELIHQLRSKRPGAAFTTDVMVGFPGEKEFHFENTKRFIKSTGFMDVHVFKFSPREGTPAATYPDQVPGDVKTTRSRELHDLAAELYRECALSFIGKTLDVLVEQKKDGLWVGHAPNYLTVKLSSTEQLRGKIIKVRITGVGDKFAVGEGIL